MEKQVIKLNEGQLRTIIKESVKNVLKESFPSRWPGNNWGGFHVDPIYAKIDSLLKRKGLIKGEDKYSCITQNDFAVFRSQEKSYKWFINIFDGVKSRCFSTDAVYNNYREASDACEVYTDMIQKLCRKYDMSLGDIGIHFDIDIYFFKDGKIEHDNILRWPNN